MSLLRSRYGLTAGVLGVLLLASPAPAKTHFVNLSNREASVARYTYQPYNPGMGGPFHDSAPQEEGWWFEGWWNLGPGEALTVDPGNYYLKNSGGPISWNGLQNSPGFVLNQRFRVFVEKRDWNQKAQELPRQGYREVQFQKFDNGTYTISGSAYRLEQQTFSFDYSSRDYQVVRRNFKVPGRVAYYTVKASSRWADPAWKQYSNSVSLVVGMEGKQTQLFAGREQGYYRGTVTVYYTVPG